MDSLAPCDMRWNNFVRMSWVKKGKRQPIRVKKNKRQPTRVTSSKGGRRLTNVTLSPQNYCSVEQHPKDKHYSAYVTCCYILCCCSLNGHLHCTCKCCIKNVTFFFFLHEIKLSRQATGQIVTTHQTLFGASISAKWRANIQSNSFSFLARQL